MSSWNKAAKANQKTHRERHQPDSRKHLGLLEKKKDYKKRSNEHHKRQRILKILRKKALNKNPDEFYMHMINSKIENGRHREKPKQINRTPEQLKLIETNNMKYISFKRTIESKKVDKLQSSLHMINSANKVKNTHVFFVDSTEDVRKFDLAKHLDTHPMLLDRKTNRIRNKDLKSLTIDEVDDGALEEKKKMYEELEKRMNRERELAVIQEKLHIKKLLKDKKCVKPKQVKPETKESAPVYKWKYDRKK